ncbi:aryl-sulfate sulfotransferase [Chloroflexota bacterium]
MNIARTMKKRVTYYNPWKADNGYTLFSPRLAKDVWLIDIEGRIVNHWRMPYPPAGHGVLLPNGNLLYAGRLKTNEELGLPREFASAGGVLLEVDWDGNLVWKAEVPYQNHDFFPMDNGHILYTTFPPEDNLPDEYAAKLKGGIPDTEFKGKVWGTSVYEIDQDGKIVWKWLSHEHLDPELDPICPLETRAKWPLQNSIWVCQDGSILFSLRLPSEVVKVDYNTGRVIGRYGRGRIFHQHDARELDNGNITVFDNGNHRHNYEASYSRVVEIDPTTDEIVWEYKANPPSDFYSSTMGGAERLPNGNSVICESQMGRIFEVTVGGEIVWEYISPFAAGIGLDRYSNSMFRAHRYTRDYPGLKGKDLDPARFPWENRTFGPDTYKKEFTPLVF